MARAPPPQAGSTGTAEMKTKLIFDEAVAIRSMFLSVDRRPANDG